MRSGPLAALVALHVVAAVGTIAAGFVAVRTAPGGRTHRRAGLAYVAGWLTLGIAGATLGARHAGISPFEVLNAIGLTLVALGYAPAALPALRAPLNRHDRRGWLRWHLRCLVASIPFLFVAGLNQLLPLLGARYSMLGLWGATALAAVLTPIAVRRLLRRHGLLVAVAPRR